MQKSFQLMRGFLVIAIFIVFLLISSNTYSYAGYLDGYVGLIQKNPEESIFSQERIIAEKAELERIVTAYIESEWRILLDQNIDLGPYYANSLQAKAKANSRKEYFITYYLDTVAKDGIVYTSVEVDIKKIKATIDKNSAFVALTCDLTYTSAFPNDKEEILSKEAGINYHLYFGRESGEWKLADCKIFDERIMENTSEIAFFAPQVQDSNLNTENQRSTVAKDISILGVYTYYDRQGAVRYADAWWNRRNPKYRSFSGDCTNYVSQCFCEGGKAPMAWVSPFVWWYNFKGTPSTSDDTWSTSWSVAHDQAYNLSRNTETYEMRGTYVSSPGQLGLGDSIYYDWEGDGILDHSAIVVEMRSGVPYVNTHSNDRYHVHWNRGASITRFLRVTDWFWHN